MIDFSVGSHRGRVREKNQDCYYVPPAGGPPIFAVADGMGGHAAGEVASSLSIQALKEKIDQNFDNSTGNGPSRLEHFLEEAIGKANERIMKAQEDNPELDGMGTTCTIAVFLEKKLFIGHVGDSQVHLFNQDEHQQLTEDHSLVMELFKTGEITADEMQAHPQRHMLTRALGTLDQVEVDIYFSEVQTNDYVLLCTDGLTSMLPIETIQELVLGPDSLDGKVEQLIHRANASGGLDNITVLLVQVK